MLAKNRRGLKNEVMAVEGVLYIDRPARHWNAVSDYLIPWQGLSSWQASTLDNGAGMCRDLFASCHGDDCFTGGCHTRLQ
jgi:hypothetical protein